MNRIHITRASKHKPITVFLLHDTTSLPPASSHPSINNHPTSSQHVYQTIHDIHLRLQASPPHNSLFKRAYLWVVHHHNFAGTGWISMHWLSRHRATLWICQGFMDTQLWLCKACLLHTKYTWDGLGWSCKEDWDPVCGVLGCGDGTDGENIWEGGRWSERGREIMRQKISSYQSDFSFQSRWSLCSGQEITMALCVELTLLRTAHVDLLIHTVQVSIR
mgnify:CR=1 FL=1